MRGRWSALVYACLSAAFVAWPWPGGAVGAMLAPAAAPVPAASSAPSPAATNDADDDDGPSAPADVVALRAKIRAAEGKRPNAERVVETIARSDESRRETTVRIGDDYRTSTHAGPFETAYGSLQGQRWHQNENGLTVLEQRRPGREALERRTVVLSHVTTPIVADVISNLDPKRRGTRTYVDPLTSRVVRIDDISANETTVSTMDDFRMTDGYTRPWHTHESDGIGVNDTDDRIDAISTKGQTAADVTIPPPRRALVTFPSGVTSVSVPCKLDDDRHFIVRVTIGGRGLDFILDTGSYGIIMDEDVARSLAVPLLSASSNAANAGRFTQHEAVVPEMHVGSLAMRDVAVGVIPKMSMDIRNQSIRAVGLLGFDFIASLALRLDYQHGTITATDYDAFVPPKGPGVVPLDIRLGTQHPETDVFVDGHVGERFDIDTGGSNGIMINDLFTRRYPKITEGFRPLNRSERLEGVGGTFDAPLYEVPHIRMGTIDFTDFSAIVVSSDRLYASDNFDGIIGPEILQKFTVTTDFADSTVFLEPSR